MERLFAVTKFMGNRAKVTHFEHVDAYSLHSVLVSGHGIDELNQMKISTQRLRAQIRMLLDA